MKHRSNATPDGPGRVLAALYWHTMAFVAVVLVASAMGDLTSSGTGRMVTVGWSALVLLHVAVGFARAVRPAPARAPRRDG